MAPSAAAYSPAQFTNPGPAPRPPLFQSQSFSAVMSSMSPSNRSQSPLPGHLAKGSTGAQKAGLVISAPITEADVVRETWVSFKESWLWTKKYLILRPATLGLYRNEQTPTPTSVIGFNEIINVQRVDLKAFCIQIDTRTAKSFLISFKNDTEVITWFDDIYNRCPLLGVSKPTNFTHKVHVGFDAKSGGFTGLPDEWARLLTASAITQEDYAKNPQAVIEVLEFYSDAMMKQNKQDDFSYAAPSPTRLAGGYGVGKSGAATAQSTAISASASKSANAAGATTTSLSPIPYRRAPKAPPQLQPLTFEGLPSFTSSSEKAPTSVKPLNVSSPSRPLISGKSATPERTKPTYASQRTDDVDALNIPRLPKPFNVAPVSTSAPSNYKDASTAKLATAPANSISNPAQSAPPGQEPINIPTTTQTSLAQTKASKQITGGDAILRPFHTPVRIAPAKPTSATTHTSAERKPLVTLPAPNKDQQSSPPAKKGPSFAVAAAAAATANNALKDKQAPPVEKRVSAMSDAQVMEKLRSVVSTGDPNRSYCKLRKVGQGASGSVYVAKYVQASPSMMIARASVTMSLGGKVAIKQMDLTHQPRKELIVNEILVMKESSHPNIVNFLDSFLVRGKELWVVMEFMEGGALTDIIDHNHLGEDQIAAICNEVGIILLL